MKASLSFFGAVLASNLNPLRSAELDQAEANSTSGGVLEPGPCHYVLRRFRVEMSNGDPRVRVGVFGPMDGTLSPASDRQASDLSAFTKRGLALLSTKTAQHFLP